MILQQTKDDVLMTPA